MGKRLREAIRRAEKLADDGDHDDDRYGDHDDDGNYQRQEMERQLGEAKKGLCEANRERQSAAARIRALLAELEEVRMDVIMLLMLF